MITGPPVRENWRLFLLTKLEIGDVALDPGTRAGAGSDLYTVSYPRGQTGNQHG